MHCIIMMFLPLSYGLWTLCISRRGLRPEAISWPKTCWWDIWGIQRYSGSYDCFSGRWWDRAMCNTQDAAKWGNSYPDGLCIVEDDPLQYAAIVGAEVALHRLYLCVLLLLGVLADHSTPLAVPFVNCLVLRIIDLSAVVLAMDGALAQLASENEIPVRWLIRETGLTLCGRLHKTWLTNLTRSIHLRTSLE